MPTEGEVRGMGGRMELSCHLFHVKAENCLSPQWQGTQEGIRHVLGENGEKRTKTG
jgi:hypothetical protein